MRPGAERWFDAEVLIDVGPSMAVWQDTALELASLLERHGAFREIRCWTLEQVTGKVRLSRAGVHSEAHQLVNPGARRLTMVVTDCIGPMWYQAPIWAAIREWGLFSPVVIINMLPNRLWPQTALGTAELSMRSHQPGTANRSLDVGLPWWWPDVDPPQSAMPVPVITLEAGPVAAWARMVMGAGGVEIDGVFATPPAESAAARSGDRRPNAEERVQRFRVTVSPVAYRLAVYLSAALRGRWGLALARVIQEAMLPASGQVHLAEVVVGGLVRRVDPHTGTGEFLFEFVDGVADVLQRSLTGTEALRMLQALGGYIERETGQSPGIAALLLGETIPTDTTAQFGAVRTGAANLIQAMGLAQAEVVPRSAEPADSVAAEPAAAQLGIHPVTITIDAEHPGPVVREDFAGLSFERGPLLPRGNAGLSGNLFNPQSSSIVTLFRNMGMHSLRIGGGSVEMLIPAGTGMDGYTGIDNLFAFAAMTGVKVIYTFRLLNPAAAPVNNLQAVNAQAAAYIWSHYRENVSSFAIGNEPDWHSYHSRPAYQNSPAYQNDPAIFETIATTAGSAYPSYLAHWRDFADAVRAAAPGAPISGPDLGAYDTSTFTPDPTGMSWTRQLASDEQHTGRVAEVSQHHYVGGSAGTTTAAQAISNMLSAQWVTATEIGTDLPPGNPYTPYPWLHANSLAPVIQAGLRYRLTESNDYLVGVPGASDAYASALWALDYLHWWAAHGCAGVNFHNKQWLNTATIVPHPAGPSQGYVIRPKGYGIKAFTLGSAGQVKPVQIQNPNGVNLTAYCVGAAGEDYVTIINKTHGTGAADAAVTIVPPSPGAQSVEGITLAGGQSGDARGTTATLGGATITGDSPWNGKWSAVNIDPGGSISLTVKATTATIVKIQSQ
jgi:hypothetical protein